MEYCNHYKNFESKMHKTDFFIEDESGNTIDDPEMSANMFNSFYINLNCEENNNT